MNDDARRCMTLAASREAKPYRFRNDVLCQLIEERLPPRARVTVVAAALGTSKQVVSYWMNGKRCPEADHLVDLAAYLGVPIHDLLPPAEGLVRLRRRRRKD